MSKNKKKPPSSKTKRSRPLPPTKPKNSVARSREFLTPAEVKHLKKAAADSTRHGFRDWLIITMIYRHAFRVSELTNLKWEQVDFQRKRLHVDRIKNGDSSVHYLEEDEIQALRKLEDEYPATEFVFSSQRQGPLTPRTVHYIIARAGEYAGLELSVHPHMLRHSKGYQLANRGEDTRTIQAYLGHKNIQHTAKYTKVVDEKQFKGLGKD